MRAVSRVPTSTSEGTTVLYRGAMSTSSNVRPVAMNLEEDWSFMDLLSSNAWLKFKGPELQNAN